jgi:hypothetical protein
MLRTFMLLLIAGAALFLPQKPSKAQDVTYEALSYYADCVNDAIYHNGARYLERRILYRCYGANAISYFNYLGRKKARERTVSDRGGVFIYRLIKGVGFCWNRVSYLPEGVVSLYGCDIYYEI